MNLASTAAALAASLALVGCGGGGEVTDAEAAAFGDEVHERVPYMQRYANEDDLLTLAKAVCEGLLSGQSYGRVSKTVGAYIDKPASSAEVDDVIAVAIETACPEAKDKV